MRDQKNDHQKKSEDKKRSRRLRPVGRLSHLKKDRIVYVWGLLMLLFGTLIILLAILIEEHHLIVVQEGTIQTLPHHWILGLKLLEHFGIALIFIGIIGIVLEFRDWREYFQERLSEIVIQRSYLNTLKDDELLSLQTATLKAYFKDDQLDRADSFLEFYQRKIHGFISSPYREDINAIIAIDYFPDDKTVFEVDETISYKCRKVRGSIQSEVKWFQYGRISIKDIQSFRITVQVPPNFFQAPDFEARYPAIKSNSMEYVAAFTKGKVETTEGLQFHDKDGDIGFILPLNEYKGIDRLFVKVDVKYTTRIGWPLSWSMTHPSKDLTVTFKYPPDLAADVNIYGIDDDERDVDKKSGIYTLKYYSWLLPGAGLDFQLGPIPAESVGSSAAVEETKREEAQPTNPTGPEKT